MTTNIIMNVMMYVMRRRRLELLGKIDANNGPPWVEDNYKRWLIEKNVEGT
jgi:hypothetical protein